MMDKLSTKVPPTAVITNRNQERLILQNKKLYIEIQKLEEHMSKIITDDATEIMKKQNPMHEKATKKMSELSSQQSYIKKLKHKILKIKALNTFERIEEIRTQEDQIIALKRQYESLLKEKQALEKNCQVKRLALDYNRPLDNMKQKTENALLKLRKENNQFQSEIVKVERDVRKLHKYQKLNKELKSQKIVQNPESEILMLEQEKKSWERRTKGVSEKWKPQLSNLDNQYFSMKEIYLRREKVVLECEKQFRLWQIRASATRNESDVLLDRERLSKVSSFHATSQKNPNTKTYFQESRKRKQYSTRLKDSPKKSSQQKMAKSLRISSSSRDLDKSSPDEEEKKWKLSMIKEGNPIEEAQLDEKNQFLPSQKKQDSPNKLLKNSIGVGTSFYYNSDQD